LENPEVTAVEETNDDIEQEVVVDADDGDREGGDMDDTMLCPSM
jgi:hypothetical protein